MIEQDRENLAWVARTSAILMRWQGHGFPSLAQLTGKTNPVRKQTPAEMKSVFASMRDLAG